MINHTAPTTVIVVDDDPITRKLVERYLKISGFEGTFLFAENGQKALPIFAEVNPVNTVVVLDYKMPELDGVGVLQAMQENGWEHKVYMHTSSPLEEHRQECLRFSNVIDYLIKPVDMSKIHRILQHNGLMTNSSVA